MSTAAELVLAEQIGHLREIIVNRQWATGEGPFRLGLPARDGRVYWLLPDFEDYPAKPPAWPWHNPETGATNQPADTPIGGTFFHDSGRICAPWNRLAYKEIDPVGPHSDWQLANWKSNPATGGTTTISAMVLRIFRELQSADYRGLKAAA